MSDNKRNMTSSRSYLLNALYQWIVDNDCTPYLVVDAYIDGVLVPQEFVKDGQIVLNVAPSAISSLNINRQSVSFKARFSGIPMDIFVPLPAVLGIYARENGQGMMFEYESLPEDPDPTEPSPTPRRRSYERNDKDKPSLRIVK